MKQSKNLTTKLVILVLLVTLVTVASLSTPAIFDHTYQVLAQQVKTWYVDDDLKDYPKADFTRIQDALNAASPGDTIVVYQGMYYGNFILSKKVSLVGTNYPILDGRGNTVVTIAVDNCSIQGFKLVSGGRHPNWPAAGIWIKSNNNVIESNILERNRFGIKLSDANRNLIKGNKIHSNDNDGISLGDSLSKGSHHNEISRNDIFSNGEYGISLWISSNNKITANNISRNGYETPYGGMGIYLATSVNNLIYLNNFTDNYKNVYTLDSTGNIWNSSEKINFTNNGKACTNYVGNYWSDYTGTDTNADGIGDVPFNITSYAYTGWGTPSKRIEGDKDHYPLMRPFENYVGVEVLYDTNLPPNRPNNISPASGASGISLAPVFHSSVFSDPDPGNTHVASQWQITRISGDYSSPIFDSGRDTSNLASITIPSGLLSYATMYYWRVRHQDDHGAWSEYSQETSFTTRGALRYELFIEIDYMPGHKPTESVLQYIEDYFAQQGISITFDVDDEVPFDEGVTFQEFWEYQTKYNEGEDWIEITKFEEGRPKLTEKEYELYKNKLTSKSKWVLYGTIDASFGALGYCNYHGTDSGNYIFIADKNNDGWASNWAFLGVTKQEAETMVLMHELGHSIGIIKLNKKGEEDYWYFPFSCVMSWQSPVNCNAKPIGYSSKAWALKDLDYYEVK